ncbi:MAG: pilus assembly protein PilP [SAR86 cluster bacterium]|uniref:Pilus assembly protein PilP n=1 Tax=SAR86 cluster bacterium TaxID=2030880 RepID=A0A2A5CJR6_9GAMM|nr:type 4a pilus biogenesis protein PilO [Gammaproteobacteria bacterium AH-315-E17]PCJ43751.1 MAG: pilus assembly protein PilP [SAR86 cluster bacterium]
MNALETIKVKINSSINELKNFDWNDLSDIETIGVWPNVVKFVLGALLFVACLGGGYWFHVKDLQARLVSVQSEETGLRSDLETKAVLASNLEPYRQQMIEMEEDFGSLLAQLPGETEVPGLLEDISETGLGSGIEFESIQLQPEQAQEFYIELPINILVRGAYHDFGAFVSAVASLPRIVTLHDFNINVGDNRSELAMQITARTYRFRSDDE